MTKPRERRIGFKANPTAALASWEEGYVGHKGTE